MEKYTKSYIIKFFDHAGDIEHEVESRDPSSIVDDGKMGGFRFYDVDFINYEGKTYKSEKHNYSNWILFGKKYNYREMEELKAKYGNDPNYKRILMEMLDMAYPYVCETTTGAFIPLSEGLELYDDVVEKHKKGTK